MTKKALLILTLTVLASMLLSVAVFAAQAKQNAADKVSSYNVPGREFTPRQLESRDLDLRTNGRELSRRSLGQALGTRGIGVGEPVDQTFEDYGMVRPYNLTIAASDVDGNVDVHFVYEDIQSSDTGVFKRSGYNVWDATDSMWPQTQGAGCLLQPSEDRGGVMVGIAVDARGFAIMQATDSEGEFADTATHHDLWFQNLRHNCTWTQSWIPSDSLDNHFLTVDRGFNGSIATQVIGTDNVLHCVVGENAYSATDPNTTLTFHPVVYFRKVGTGSTGVWTDGQVIDNMFSWFYRIAVQQNGQKVAVCYTNNGDSARQEDNVWDNDVYYRESTDGGVNWGSVVCVTNYSARRTTQITGAALRDIGACYDNNGGLHIVFGAQEVPVMPYRNGWSWNDFNSDIWHWSNASSGPYANGNLSKVVDGTYDPLDNPGYWNVRHCGFGPSLWSSYCWNPTVSQCGDYIYVVWGQMHHRISALPGPDTANAINDCSADERENNANWEVFVAVSNGLSGLLWDSPRSLTETYTPDCHPDSGIACGNEWMPRMSIESTDDDGSLKWPDNEVIPGDDPTFTSGKYLHVMYLDDEVPGSWWLGDTSGGNNPTLNDVKWIRMACVDPEGAAVIVVSQGDVVWPEYVKNGAAADVYNVTITNTGNLALDISSLDVDELSGSGWLSATNPPASIPAGSGNTGTFTITVTPPSIGSPDQFLHGQVTINSNADNNPAYTITFNILAADVIYDVQYDIAATSTAWDSKGGMGLGDNVALAVSNYGEIGNSGEGGVGLDFVVDGDDCDTTITHYLYAASPFFMHDNGTSIELTTSHYSSSAGLQGNTESWDPADSAMTGGTGTQNDASFDYVYAGKSYNRDTTAAIERTVYAPRDNANNPSFVLCKTALYSLGGAIEHVTFGTATDWDVPSDDGSLNTSAVTQPTGAAGVFVYFRGTDTAGSDACQSNLDRYAAEVVAGWYATSELVADPCANNEAIYGMTGVNVRDYFDDIDDGDEPDAQLWWDTLGNKPGYTGEPDEFDQGGFVTFLYDYTLPANDTLVFWTVLSTMHNGTLAQFEANIADAKDNWYWDLRGRCGCCVLMGNVDGEGDVTMGDLTVLIDHLFISYNPLTCADEGNVDLEGDVTMGDLTVLIDNLFISYEPLPDCSELP